MQGPWKELGLRSEGDIFSGQVSIGELCRVEREKPEGEYHLGHRIFAKTDPHASRYSYSYSTFRRWVDRAAVNHRTLLGCG